MPRNLSGAAILRDEIEVVEISDEFKDDGETNDNTEDTQYVSLGLGKNERIFNYFNETTI